MPATTQNIKLRGTFQDDISKPVKSASKKTSGALASMAKKAAVAAAAYVSLRAAINIGREMVSLAAQADSVSKSFDRLAILAGRTADVFLTELREATKGTISDLNLMKKANEAALLGGEALISDLPRLIEIARASAAATGQSFEFLFDSIVLGIGRQSKLILDNLGIIVNVEDANKKYADTLGTTAAALTDAEKKQAFMNAVMESGDRLIRNTGGGADLATDAFDRLDAQSDNLKKTIGNKLLPIMQDLAGSLADAVEATNELVDITESERLDEALEKQGALVREFTEIQKEASRGTAVDTERLKFLAQEIQTVTIEIDNLNKSRRLQIALTEEKQRLDAEERARVKAIEEADPEALIAKAKEELLLTDAQRLEDLKTEIMTAGVEERLELAKKAAELEIKIAKDRADADVEIVRAAGEDKTNITRIVETTVAAIVSDALKGQLNLQKQGAILAIKLLKETIKGFLKAQAAAAIGNILAQPGPIALKAAQIARVSAKFRILQAVVGGVSSAAIGAISAGGLGEGPTAAAAGAAGAAGAGVGAGGGGAFAAGAGAADVAPNAIAVTQRVIGQLQNQIRDLQSRGGGLGRFGFAADIEALRERIASLQAGIAATTTVAADGAAGGGGSLVVNFSVSALDPESVDWDKLMRDNIGPALQSAIGSNAVVVTSVPE